MIWNMIDLGRGTQERSNKHTKGEMAIKAWKQGRSKEDDYIVEGLSGQQKVKLSTEWRTAVN